MITLTKGEFNKACATILFGSDLQGIVIGTVRAVHIPNKFQISLDSNILPDPNDTVRLFRFVWQGPILGWQPHDAYTISG